MRSRILSVSILACWLSVWLSAASHQHDHGAGSCSHGISAVETTVGHSHAHRHGGLQHGHFHCGLHRHAASEPDDAEPLPVISTVCRLCEFLAISFSTSPLVSVPVVSDLIETAFASVASAEVAIVSFSWQQRGPPSVC